MKWRYLAGILIWVSWNMASADPMRVGILKALTPDVAKAHIGQLLGYIASNKCDMVPVFSPWHATNITTRSFDQTPIRAARNFGGALFLRVEDWAAEAKAAKPAADSVRRFMDLADWLMKSPGYGNFFIAKRCHEIAAYGIARACGHELPA